MRTNKWMAGMVTAALVLAGGTGTAWAQQGAKQVKLPPPQRSVIAGFPGLPGALKGLKGVHVVVAFLSDDAKKMGLTEERLQSAVELSLRRNKVPVLTMEEWLATLGGARLHIRVTVVGPAFNIRLELLESVRLERDPGTRVIGATTWGSDSTGTLGSDTNSLIKDVERMVDEFCLDYRGDQPKVTTTGTPGAPR